MEHHAQSVDDALIGGLSYKLEPGASYVTNMIPLRVGTLIHLMALK